MFEFLKPKIKMRPEEFGVALATVLVTVWLEKITKHSKEYGKLMPGITQGELGNLWQLFLVLHCTEISVGVETSNAENKRIILDSFWSSVRDLLNENNLEKEATVFQSKIAQWYEALRRLAMDIDSAFPSPGSLGPGKVLFLMAFPNRDIRENIDLITHLTGYFVATETALQKFVSSSIKKTKLLPSMISYE